MLNFIEKLSNGAYVTELYLVLDLLLASILGFCIGFERKTRSKEAGIKTHTVVSFGAALMMIISKYAFGDGADTARIAAQIVAGIGFLGAGIIVYDKNKVHGLTTAAGVWATAGIGMACGGGLYIVAVIATILLIFVQWLLHRNNKFFNKKSFFTVGIVFYQKDAEREKVKQIFGVEHYNNLVIERDGDKCVFKATLNTDVLYSTKELDTIMKENPFIISIERNDDN